METITSTSTKGADFTIAIAIDKMSGVYFGIALFLAITLALIIYKKS